MWLARWLEWLVLATLFAACSGPVCTGAQVACDGTCVDVQLDPGHCGTCDHACELGDVCSLATCAASCLANLDECGGRCVDKRTDRNNCGSCGHACGGADVCSGGQCAATCDPLSRCDDRCVDLATENADCGTCGHSCPQGQFCSAGACTSSNIKHVVLIVEENHTFETYFGAYCRAPAGSQPTCTAGPACCEAAPATEASGSPPVALTDFSNELKDRDHERVCEVAQIDGGAMDHFVVGSGVVVGTIEGLYTYDCSDPNNFAVADASTVQPYWTYADRGALADRYFQPMTGSTSGNDMYFAVAQWQFNDNDARPFTIGSGCLAPGGNPQLFGHIATIGDLLVDNGYSFRMYADGYADAVASVPYCASAKGTFPADCEPFQQTAYSTCDYDPADLPFEYYAQFADKAQYIVDTDQLARDVAAGELPSFAFVKPRTYRNEHPKWSTISKGVAFVGGIVDTIEQSPYADDTLVLLTWDEGGGFYDHVAPPASQPSQIDADSAGQPVPYGTRVPMLAIGPFARTGGISHVVMEHSSVVRFLEHNFLGPKYAGALRHRDAAVANLGSLLDPTKTGITVP